MHTPGISFISLLPFISHIKMYINVSFYAEGCFATHFISFLTSIETIRLVQKFLPIFCNFFITIKKSIQYKLIEVFFIFFPSFRNSPSFTAARRSLSPISKSPFFKSFKSIRTCSNNYTSSSYVSQILLCAAAFFFWWKQNKKQWRICSLSGSIFNRTKCKIMLTFGLS